MSNTDNPDSNNTPRAVIRTTLKALSEAAPALGRLAGVKMPARTAYRLRRILGGVEAALNPFFEQRNELVRRFGTAEGDQIVVRGDEAAAALLAELQPLLDEVVELPFAPIYLDDLGDAEVTATDLILLDGFVVDPLELYAEK